MVERQTAEDFVRPHHKKLLLRADHPDQLLDQFAAFVPVARTKWVERSET
jgi:hypothetical protein